MDINQQPARDDGSDSDTDSASEPYSDNTPSSTSTTPIYNTGDTYSLSSSYSAFFSTSSSDGEYEPQPRGEEHYWQIGEGFQDLVGELSPNVAQAGPAEEQLPIGIQAELPHEQLPIGVQAGGEPAPRFVPNPRNDPINNPTIVGILDEADAEMALERAQAVGQIVNEIDNFRVLAYINY